jgi:predicted transcriptional regulator
MSEMKANVLSRGEMLKALRAEHAASVERAQVLFKEQKQMQQSICQFIRETPKTVPEIAKEIGKPTHEVLWFMAVMKKYGIVVEAGMCGDYPLYQRAKEVQA